MVSKKYYYDIDLRGNRLLNFAVESVSGDLPSDANEGAVIYHSGEGVMYQRLKDGWKVIASGKDLEDALSKVSEDLQALSKDTEDALDTKADKTTVSSLSNTLTKEIQDRQAGDNTNATAISTHATNKSNPHGVTKGQVGLGNVDNTSDANKPISTATQNALNLKADKTSMETALNTKQDKLTAGTNITISGTTISAKDTTYSVASSSANGLMSSTDKSKLDGIASGAQVNSITGVKGNSETTYRTGNVNITKANIGLGNVDNTSDVNKPISTAVQNALNGKAGTSVATQSANGLMSSTDKSKLDGIASGAQVNVIETVKVNGTALTPSSKAVNIDLSDYAKKSDVTTVMRYKGSVSTVTSLPTTATLGDTYNVIDTNANYTWDGSAWDLIGSTVDLSSYATKTEVDSALSGKVSKSGDTMTGALAFNTTETNVIFITNPSADMIAGTSSYPKGIYYKDKNGQNMGVIRVNTRVSGYDTPVNYLELTQWQTKSDGSTQVGTLTVNSDSSGEAWATAPSWSVGTNDNSDKVLTIKMANSLPSLVHSTGNETVAGNKVFTGQVHFKSILGKTAGSPSFWLAEQDFTRGTIPSRECEWSVQFRDNAGTSMSSIRNYMHTDGTARLQIGVDNYNASKTARIILRSPLDGAPYIEATATPTNATSNEIVTANWSIGKFVKRSGDTMTNSLGLTYNRPVIRLKSTEFAYSDPVGESTTVFALMMNDKNDAFMGGLFNRWYSNGDRKIYLENKGKDGKMGQISLWTNASGVYAEAPTPSNNSDNSTAIATTEWVTKASSVVHTDRDETIQGIKTFLANPVIRSNLTLVWKGPPTVENVNENITKDYAGFSTVGNFLAKASNGEVGGVKVFRSTPGGYAASITNLIADNASGTEVAISLVARDDGTMYAQAPSTHAGAIGNEIATADWSIGKFVQKSGDTMTGALTLSRNGWNTMYFRQTNLDITNVASGVDNRPHYIRTEDMYQRPIHEDVGFVFSTSVYRALTSNFYDADGNKVSSSWLNIKATPNNGAYLETPSWSVGTNDNSDKVLTIKMANSLPSLVHTTSNETIAGDKTYSGKIISTRGGEYALFKFGNIKQGSTNENWVNNYIGAQAFYKTDDDGNDVYTPIWQFETIQETAGLRTIRLSTNFHGATSTSSWVRPLAISEQPDGSIKVVTINPDPDATSNEIATANWVNDKLNNKIVASTTDIGEGSALATGTLYVVYE